MIFFDTETCGLYGPIILIQYAIDDSDIHLHSVWTSPIHETLTLIKRISESEICGFNLAYDWFHICQTYTTLKLLNPNWCPEDHIEEYAEAESRAMDGPCLKPKSALDLMLHARKGSYQSMMNRKSIRIKRVPFQLAWELADELSKRIPLKDAYFARKADPTHRWSVVESKKEGKVDQQFRDLELSFAPSSALKALAIDAGIAREHRLKYEDIELPRRVQPVELGYAPYAYATGKPGRWHGAWPDVIRIHITHWCYNKFAREYAEDDVHDTRGLYYHFNEPEHGDDDSVLACAVGAMRWRGYRINENKIKALKEQAKTLIKEAKVSYNAPHKCKEYLCEVMDPTEQLVIQESTKFTVLEEVTRWTVDEVCSACNGFGCDKCEEGLIKSNIPHPAALRAQHILDCRHATKEIELYDKLLTAGRFHASFNIIGALSSRMSGSDGLNPQGIKKAESVRDCFELAWPGDTLCGGDFDAFEVTLMDAEYQDPKLREELLSGKSIHGLFGTYLFNKSYEEIMSTKGLPQEKNLYGRSKNGVFALAYGGEANTLVTRVGVMLEHAEDAYRRWTDKYTVWKQRRQEIFNMFCSMRQPGGIGSKVEWHEPAEYIESMMGFRRYFTLENSIVRALYNLANKPPKHWKDYKIKVVRRDRIQTASGAIQSALYAAAFAVQAANMRAAGNHVIQSSGATITKGLQRRLWNLQPYGISDWVVQPMNIHDEIMCPMQPAYKAIAKNIVTNYIEELKPKVPLIGITWKEDLKSWANK